MMNLRWTTVLLAIGLAGCESTAPADRIDGVWAARVAPSGPGDSLTLALGLDGTQLGGFAILRTSSAPQSLATMFNVGGTFIDGSADVMLATGNFGPVKLHLSREREV